METLALGNLVAYSAQVVCVVGLATLLWALLRIDAAPVRYGYWRAILALCLLLPLLQGRQAPPPAPAATAAVVGAQLAAAEAASPATPASISWTAAIIPILVCGATARLLWIGLSLLRLRRLRRQGERVAETAIHTDLQEIIGTRCEMRYVAQLRQPVTFGLRRPVILLPVDLARHPLEIQQAVLTHELFHVKRRDWGWLVVEEIVCAVLWFNPAVWWLVSRVHLAREVVVDELAVLATGRRRAYVQALMTFADETSLAPVAAFGGRRQLFDRLVLLSKEAVMSSHRLVFTCAVMFVAIAAGSWRVIGAFPLTGDLAQAAQQNAPGPLEQRAHPITPENPIPRRVIHEAPIYPGEAQAAGARGSVTLMITLDELGRVAEARRLRLEVNSTDPAVSLTFSGVEPADMERFIGRQSADQSQAVSALAAAFTDAALRAVQQWRYDPPAAGPMSFPVTVTFTGSGRATATQGAVVTARGSAADRGPVWAEGAIRVGGNIKTPTKIRDVRPAYPPIAQAAGVAGVVIIEARIGTDGSVEEARVLRSIPLLDQAAVDAVMQWRFVPTLLNGQAVPVIMTVTVNFRPDAAEAIQVMPRQVMPRVIKEVKPRYTREALEAGVGGWVEVEATVGTDGKVVDARVLRGIPMLNESALAAVRQWEFSPVPHPVAVKIELSFTVKGGL